MDDFELRLKSLSVGAPSENLRERIFGQEIGRHKPKRLFDRRIPLSWAALMMMAMGVAGFAAARLGEKAPRPIATSGESKVQIQLVAAPVGRQVFDFTQTSNNFLGGQLSVQTESGKGT